MIESLLLTSTRALTFEGQQQLTNASGFFFEQDLNSGDLPWILLGIHSARLDVGTRDLKLDEALRLNCSWYADVLLKLTEN